MKIHKPVYYGDYLQLPRILDAQDTESKKYGKEAHDETLFIIIHQTYELWFKQILHELYSIKGILNKAFVPSTALATVSSRIERVTSIQQILIDQINVMETMTSLDFMEFRDYLVPASGFQSLQFRLIEANLGIKAHHRMEIEKQFFTSRLKEEDREKLTEAEQEISIFELIETWLERMPFSKFGNFDFWGEYSQAVQQMLSADEDIISKNPILNEATRQKELASLEITKETFKFLLDPKLYEKVRSEGKVRLSQKAMLSAIFIYQYRDYPALQMPYKILNGLVEIDEKFTTWRYRHAIMVQRILGTKIGTGGSSGHEFLKSTTERNRAFIDFFNLATFLIPKHLSPTLPAYITKELDIVYEAFKP